MVENKFDENLKICHNCKQQFQKLNKHVVDVGEDFCAEFKYQCPYCETICKTDKEMRRR